MKRAGESKMKTYYHVSMDYQQEIKEFVPRIPRERASGEDELQKRICVSTTLTGCVKAAPLIWYQMYTYVNAEYYDPYTHMSRLTTLLDHENKVGCLVKVYEFKLEEKELIAPNLLKENGWVPDADKTNEHWIMKATKPSRSYYALLENLKEENEQPVFDFTQYEQHELGEIESYLETFDKQRKKDSIGN